MWKQILYLVLLIICVFVLIISCKKEYSCEGCTGNNKPPIAIAGPDQDITLPTDSISLDGSASNDPDGTISVWLWRKISGPASFQIASSTIAKTVVKNLITGVYQFELAVTDNMGLSAKDTLQVEVNDASQPNRPPVANAGPDQVITLPLNTINLDGSASTDPDNNISTYLWTKISGPSSSSINNAGAAQTQVTNLIEGIYQFELKVTDGGGLFAKDTMQVIVNIQPSSACNIDNRPVITAQLIPIGNLSEARGFGMAVASVGNKILFAGGNSYGNPSSRVDIFDMMSGSWSTAELSMKRSYLGTAVLGDKIFFAGGQSVGSLPVAYDHVDIYNTTSNTWTVAFLNEPRAHIAAAAIDNKVFFAGGGTHPPSNPSSDRVDVFDQSTNSWSVAKLTVPRFDISAVASGNKIYFAGGTDDAQNSLNAIDIYDNDNNSWSASSLQFVGDGLTGVAVGNNIYWAGLAYPSQFNVEIKNLSNGTTTGQCLSYVRYMPEVVVKNNKIIFFTGTNGNYKNRFDIYDISTDSWSVGMLPIDIEGVSIICVNNTIYIAGGIINGTAISNVVWKLEF